MPRIAHHAWLRIGLIALAVSAGTVGVWALFAPESFFASFPGFGQMWVAMLPPYNEHLVRDVGELNLAFAVLFSWAAVVIELHLVRAALAAWLVAATPHLLFHLAHLEHFSPPDAAAELFSLNFVVALPIVLLFALARPARAIVV